TQGEFTLVVDGPRELAVGTIELLSSKAIDIDVTKYFQGLSEVAKYGIRVEVTDESADAQAQSSQALLATPFSAASATLASPNPLASPFAVSSATADADEPEVTIPSSLEAWLSFDPETGRLFSTKEQAAALASIIDKLKLTFFAKDNGEDLTTEGELIIDNGATSEKYYFTYDAANRVKIDAGVLNGSAIELTEGSQYIEYDVMGRAERVYTDLGKTLQRMTYNAQGSLIESHRAYDSDDLIYNFYDNRNNLNISGIASQDWYSSVKHDYNLLQQVERTVNYFAADQTVDVENFTHPKAGRRKTVSEVTLANSVRTIQTFDYTDDGKIEAVSDFSISSDDAVARINGSEYSVITEADVEQVENHMSRTTYLYDDAGRTERMFYNQLKRPALSGDDDLPDTYTQRFKYSYEGRDSYLEKLVDGSGTGHFGHAKTESFYDANGNRIAIEETKLGTDNKKLGGTDIHARYFDYTADGKLVRRQHGEQSETHKGVRPPLALAEAIESARNTLTDEYLFNLPLATAERYIDNYMNSRSIGFPPEMPIGTQQGILSILDRWVSAAALETIAEKIDFAPTADNKSHYLFNGSQYLGELKENGDINVKSAHLQSVNPNSATSSRRHTIRDGETLRTLANQFYGDANLWYVIADANGLTQSADGKLTAGQSINIPEQANTSNRFDTFTPYNVAEVIGDTTPNVPYIPPPPEAGCNALASIIIIAIVIIVTVYTAGAASGVTGATTTTTTTAAGTATATTTAATGTAASAAGGAISFGTAGSVGATFKAGTAALAGTLGANGAVAASIGGFTGALAGQAAGNILGVQDGYSLKDAFASGLTAGLTAGVGSGLRAGTFGAWATKGTELTHYGKAALAGASVVTGAYSNTLVGKPSGFRWANVAASAGTAFIGSALEIGGENLFEGLSENGFAGDALGGIARSGINYAIKKGFFNEGSWNFVDVATDAFGNALGNSLVRGAQNADRNREIEAGKRGLSPAQLQELERRAQLTDIPLEEMLAARGAEVLYDVTDSRFYREGFEIEGAILRAAAKFGKTDGVPGLVDVVPDDNFDRERFISVRNDLRQFENEDRAEFDARVGRYINTYDGLDNALELFSSEDIGHSLNSLIGLSEFSDTGNTLIGYVAEGEEYRFYDGLHRIDTVALNRDDARIFGDTFLAFATVASGAAQLYVGANPVSALTPAPIRGALLTHGVANVTDGLGQLEEIFLGSNHIDFQLQNSDTNNPLKLLYSKVLSPLGVGDDGVNLLFNTAELGLSAASPLASSPSRLKGLDRVFARPPRPETAIDDFFSGAQQLSNGINLNQAQSNPIIVNELPSHGSKTKVQLQIEKLIREGRY
ncbi:LysM peptidoglycan-binding domain-containing protein, partial [Agaribacter marinus]|uniref:LysM peptidoglycan-binding domain-containing protein n=1 Tax=Agaribacter marinus TaxID=1431249 RepID=UPI0024E17395